MKNRSTVTNVVCKGQYIAEKVDSQSQDDALYTDFSKTFDRLYYRIVSRKLTAFDINMSNWKIKYVARINPGHTLIHYVY